MSPKNEEDAECHFIASGVAAIINFPLWRASAIAQSGFKMEGANIFQRYYKAIQPPYRGVLATMLGMTWARGAIFFFSDSGKHSLQKLGAPAAIYQTVPPLLIGTFVQVVNMPIVRATITIQDPSSHLNSVTQALIHIYKTRGISGLWHGVSAGIMKTVPKYVTAIAVRDFFDDYLPHGDRNDKNTQILRSAAKSVSAGVAGAALTNPLDVIRNEMFKTDHSFMSTTKSLLEKEGWAFMNRGMASNLTAVAVPIAVTIFTTDMLKALKHNHF